jgi:Raf kinase inhibitor-like YbhB/YbcL family protein
MRLAFPTKIVAIISVVLLSNIASAEFKLSSPAFGDGDFLPDDLKCIRDGGDGLSPPLGWTDVPAGTKSFALIEHHYPRGTVEGVDDPSYCWLLWNIPARTDSISRGNTESVGNEGGGTKLGGNEAYVPPCSPPESGVHTYVITVYALDSVTIGLADHDDRSVDWATLTKAIEGKVIAQSSISFQSGHPRSPETSRN